MADTKIASLTDGLTTSGTDRIPVAISPYGSGNNAYITPSYLKTFMVTGGTVTSSTPVFDMTQTWNSGAVTFSGLKLNITNTASASDSLLMDLQVGGSSKFNVGKLGNVVATGIIQVGNYVTSEADPGVWLTRSIDMAGSGNAHGFADTSMYRRTSMSGFACAFFDGYGKVVVNTATTADHVVSFQSRPTILGASASGIMNYVYGFYDAPSIDTGVITYRYGAQIKDVLKTSGGTVDTQYGLYIDDLTGATTNWALYAAGSTPSYFGGIPTFAGGITITQATANAPLISSTGGSLTGSSTQAMIDLAFTWNTSGLPTGFKLNVTDTASNGSSLLMDLQKGGVSQFRVTKSGQARPTSIGIFDSADANGVSLWRAATGALTIYGDTSGSTAATKLCMGSLNVANPMWKKSSADWQARLGDDSGFAVVQGKLKTDTAYTATPPTCTGYITIYDSTGTPYKVMVST